MAIIAQRSAVRAAVVVDMIFTTVSSVLAILCQVVLYRWNCWDFMFSQVEKLKLSPIDKTLFPNLRLTFSQA